MTEGDAERTVQQQPPKSETMGGALTADFVRSIVEELDQGQLDRVRVRLADLHEADIADLLGLVGPYERRLLVTSLGRALSPEILSELGEDVRDEVLALLGPQRIADAVKALDTDDAVYLLADLDEEQRKAVLARVPELDRAAVELSLRYPDYTAGRLMQHEFVVVPSYWTVGQALAHLRQAADLPEEFSEIFVVDPSARPQGTIPVSRLVRAGDDRALSSLIAADLITIPAIMPQEEVAHLFEQYHLVSAPVVDEASRIVGMITADDVVNVIQEEATEDILALGGVRDEAEGMTANVFAITRSRFSWLFVNLLTAIMASAVIGLFDGTIEKVVALAVLMPIVASMGGNAGTQTLTVAVRALAMRELNAANAVRIVFREVFVSGLNGIIFAVLLGAIGGFWYGSVKIGIVLAAAMIINLICAGFAGILVPLGLNRMDIDPAVSSTVFVTTVTDCVGFFVFLGLATLYFG
jgi:magnesium transporter